MKSNLFKQLEQLKTTQTARDLKKNRYASILFPFQQASALDRDTIKSIASQGFANLIVHDPTLQNLRERLFNPDMDGLQREQLTATQNQEISEFIQEAIRELAPYFLLEDCQKVFEYLLRNFEVHNYEADTLIVALMPYHSTVFYVKLLQNIDLKKTTHWVFMEKNVKEGLIIPRGLIARQCVLDGTILDLITRNIIKMVESKATQASSDVFFNVGGASSSLKTTQQKNIEVSFGMLVAVEIIVFAKEKKKLNENLLMTLMRFLSFCLKSSNNEVFRAGLVVILQLTSSASVSSQYIQAIVLDVSRKISEKSLLKDILLLYVYVHQISENIAMPIEVFRELVDQLDHALPILVDISETFSIANLVLAFYRHVCNYSNYQDEDLMSNLVRATARLLQRVVDTEPHLQESFKRLHLTKLLVQEIFDTLATKTQVGTEEDKFVVISYLASLLTEVKNLLPDQATEALKEILQNGEGLGDFSKQVKRLLTSTFSRLYIEGVLGVEVSEESGMETEYKQLLPSISPYHPISTAQKLKALERIEELVESGSMEVEGEDSLQATLSNIVLSHFRTHSYNEKVLASLLKSQRIQSLIDVETFVKQLIDFLAKYYKTPANKEISEAVKLIYTVVIERYSELSGETAQEVKEFLVETLFSQRATVLRESLKNLKTILPTYFKPIKPTFLDLGSARKVKEGILDSFAKAIGIDGLVELDDEYKRAKSLNFKELIRLLQLSALEGVATVLPNVPEYVFGLLRSLREFTPTRVNEFVTRVGKIAEAINGMEKNKRLDSKPQIINLAIESIYFLVSLQDTHAVSVLKEFIELFGEDKLTYLLLLGHQIAKKNQEKQFMIVSLFIHNILSSENFEQKNFFHEILLVLPFLEVESRQIKLQALSILSKISQKFKKQASDSIVISGYGDFYIGNILNDNLFEIQLMAFDEQITIPSAPFNKFIKNILKHENELAGSSSSKAFSHILEKLGTSFTDYEWLFRFIIGNLFALPVRSLFNLALEIFSFISGKFHQEVVQREEIRHLLINLEKVLLSGHQAASVSHLREIELVGSILQKSGKIYTDSNSTTLVNDYFNKVYTKIAKMCYDNESPLAHAVLNSFGKTNYILLAHENQLELLELMFSVTAQGVSMSAILTSLTEVDPTDDILIMFGENMLENFNADSHLIERLTFLAELFIYLNRKSLKYLPLLNQIYQHVLTKPQEDVISFIKQIRYALSLFVGLHRQILVATIDSKASIDYSKTTPVVHKKSKSSVPIKNIAGDFVESNDSYIFIASLNDLASLLLNKDNGALLEDTTMFALVKELFGCLTTYTAFLSSSTSHILVKLLAPLFKSIESKGPKMQVYTLRLFGHILNLAHTTLRTHFDIHPYIKLFLRVLSLKGKVASQTAGLAKNANYDINEVEREIGTIIKTIGQKNLDYIVYGMISNLMKRVATDAKEKVQRKQVVAHDAEINSAINIVFSSERLEDSVNVLSKIISSTYNVCAYYLSRVLELDKKKKKILVKTGSTAKGKKLVSNYSLLKLQTQRSFLSISLYFGEKSLQSNEFMTAFSNYLIKGNFQPEVIEEFANLITSLAELKHLISQGLSKLQTGKLLKHTKATGTNTTLKKKVKTKTFLKNTSVLVEKLLGGLQELIPEELLTLTCCRILEREPTLRIKSKVLQIFSDKLASIGSPRLTVKSLGKFRGLVEASLVDNKEQLLDSKSLETSNYLQSVFMSLSTILKKKPKVFEDGLNDNVFDYVKHSVFPVRCSVFYMLALFSEKFSNKAIANLPTISVELLWTVLTCIKNTEQRSFEVIAQIAAEKNLKVLGEIATRGQSDDDEVPQSPEGCFILCINSLILLLKTYKDMMNPYVLSIILIFSCLSADQTRVEELLNFVNTHIEARNLIEPLSIAGDVQHRFSPIFGKRIAKLVGNACEKMEADTFESKNQTLFKLFLRVFDYARNVSEVKEEPLTEEENQNVEEVQSVWTDSFCRFALKTNEVQLKKYFLKLNEWSSKIMSEEERMFSLSRKIIVYQLVTKLFETLRGFFVSYMAFFFDFCIDQLVHYAQTYKTVQKTSRRKKQEGDMTKIWEVKLHNLILLTLQKCFAYDKENDFIDSSKFDKIVDPLVDQLDCIGIPVKYDNFIDNSVQPAIIELFELVKDDYKWKSLNYALLMKTRSEVSTIRLAAIKILLRVIEQLKERTAVLIQDILPFLSETLEDEDIQVEKISKEIVIRLEQITGENIKEYLKS